MGFDLGRAAAGIATGGMSEVFGALKPGSVNMGDYNAAVAASMADTKKAYGQAMDAYDPYMQSTTVGGISKGLSDIRNSNIYSGLVDERADTMKNYLGDVGLRSGYATNEMADLSNQTLFDLYNQQVGRQYQGANAMSGLYTGQANALTGIRMGGASANVNAQQQEEQAKAAMISSLIGGGAQIGGAMLGNPALMGGGTPAGGAPTGGGFNMAGGRT
jgi:hypothetical protein